MAPAEVVGGRRRRRTSLQEAAGLLRTGQWVISGDSPVWRDVQPIGRIVHKSRHPRWFPPPARLARGTLQTRPHERNQKRQPQQPLPNAPQIDSTLGHKALARRGGRGQETCGTNDGGGGGAPADGRRDRKPPTSLALVQ